MKLFKGKKGVWFAAIIPIIVGIIFLFSFTGILKFLMTDKTPLILGGLLLFLIIRKKNRG